MSVLNVAKVVGSLPGTLTPDTIYAVRTGVGFDLYVTDSTGAIAHPPNIASQGTFTGMVTFAMRASPPPGWIVSTGTIGDSTSAATTRANADCEALFLQLWSDFANTYAPVAGGRGASAAADWAAHKRIGIPDARGRILAAQDNLGGTAASIITVAGSGINATIPGNVGGLQNHALLIGEMPSHSHSVSTRLRTGALVANDPNRAELGDTSNTASSTAAMLSSTGGGGAHNNMPPVLILPLFVKL